MRYRILVLLPALLSAVEGRVHVSDKRLPVADNEYYPFECPEGEFCTDWFDGCNQCGYEPATDYLHCGKKWCECLLTDSCTRSVCMDNDQCVLLPSPSATPTGFPSVATDEPTATPSADATDSPTAAPTISPTKAQTQAPTGVATTSPTVSQTGAPTINGQTTSPTGDITTSSPTGAPTSDAQTNAPTSSPTVVTITSTPTGVITASPTGSSTGAPTTDGQTASSPTLAATSAPTGITAASPSVAQTGSPTSDGQTTFSPTAATTGTPTINGQTNAPTVATTATPTGVITAGPTGAQTGTPTTDGQTTSSPTLATTSTPTEDTTSSPTDAQTPTPTRDGQTNAPTAVLTGSPTSEGQTNAPTLVITSIPTEDSTTSSTRTLTGAPTRDGQTTSSPTMAITSSPTVLPVVTSAPTSDAQTGTPTSFPTGITGSPTQAKTSSPTGTTAPTVAQSSAPSPAFTCTDNPKDYPVNLDIQIQFPGGQAEACSSAEDRDIALQVQSALNDNFPTTVPDWDGDAFFGPFVFDSDQAIDNLARRRRLGRKITSRQQQPHRSLQEGTCSLRDPSIECLGDSCRWGCTTASTTDCGTSELTNWVFLADDVRERLAGLGYSCLGDPDLLDVILLIVDPDARSSQVRASVPDRRGTDPNSLLQNEGDETASDIVTKALNVKSTFTITFFSGTGALPEAADVDTAVQETILFFSKQFRANPKFVNGVFQEFQMSNVSQTYDPTNNPDEFVLQFMATILVAEDANVNVRDAALVMGGAPYRKLIRDYIRGHGGEFEDTFKIHFRGTAPANRRRLGHSQLEEEITLYDSDRETQP